METIENLTKYYMRGYYLLLRRNTMMPGVRPIIATGCNYNVRKVLHVIATSDAGNTKAGIPYLSK